MTLTPGQKYRRRRERNRKRLLQRLNRKSNPARHSSGEEDKGSLHRPRKLPRVGTSSDATEGVEAPDVESLLLASTKEQLVAFLCDAALGDPDLHGRIRVAAEREVSHRKLFVHGLGWDVTEEGLRQAFSPYGAVDECNVVVDKTTGRGKGYGFVLFQSRSGAVQALKEPQKLIGGRVAYCQLAALGPTGAMGGAAGHHADTAGRKIYITNVHADTNPEKLKVFFAKFGDIEMGPTGFDSLTGKSKGYAIFVYKTKECARRALEEPYKMFEGRQLHCQWASEPAKVKELFSAEAGVIPTAAGVVGAAPQSVLAAVAAAQSFSWYSQNPAYAALFGQNPLLAAAAGSNPSALATPTLNALALSPAVNGGLAGYGGSSSLLGAYGNEGTGLWETHYGQLPLGSLGGSYDGMSSYL